MNRDNSLGIMEPEEEQEELVNQCMGILPNSEHCQKRLQKGKHFCKECRSRNERAQSKKRFKNTTNRSGNLLSGEAR